MSYVLICGNVIFQCNIALSNFISIGQKNLKILNTQISRKLFIQGNTALYNMRRLMNRIKINLDFSVTHYLPNKDNTYSSSFIFATMLFKNIHIGKLVQARVNETDFSVERIINFLQCSEEDLEKMYDSASLDSEILLKWSKLLKYDFFRMYSQHLLLYSPPSSVTYNDTKNQKTELPEFRKNIYTVEIIQFILDLLRTNEKSKQQIISEYKIPKTTLYKWLKKY